jgi:signal peptidase II
MRRTQRRSWVGSILLLTVGCDQATKKLAVENLKDEPMQSFLGDIFRLGYAENPGAFLGLGGRMPEQAAFWVLVIGVGAMLAALAVYLFANRSLTRWTVVSLALILAGGFSNWVDRLANDGRVVDFLNLGLGPVRTGIFNVADVAIMAGAALAFFSAPRQRPADPLES